MCKIYEALVAGIKEEILLAVCITRSRSRPAVNIGYKA